MQSYPMPTFRSCNARVNAGISKHAFYTLRYQPPVTKDLSVFATWTVAHRWKPCKHGWTELIYPAARHRCAFGSVKEILSTSTRQSRQSNVAISASTGLRVHQRSVAARRPAPLVLIVAFVGVKVVGLEDREARGKDPIESYIEIRVNGHRPSGPGWNLRERVVYNSLDPDWSFVTPLTW